MRTFLALDPPDTLRDPLDALVEGLRCGRHVDVDDLHLTLAFMADAPLPALEELNLDLEMLRPGPVPLEIRGLGTFGAENPRSLHAAVVPHPALLHAQKKVATAVRRAGIDLPRTRFVPHVTLARFPHRMPPEDHARLGRFLSAHGSFRLERHVVEAVSLYRSTVTHEGARYELLESYPLG